MSNIYNELTSIMDISAIVHEEKYRVDQKSVGIKSAIDSQNRMIFLNQSYAKRMREYSYMTIILAITIILIVFTLVFKNFIPTFLVSLLIFFFILVGGIWALIIYIGIVKRDSIDFDKLHSTIPQDTSGNAIVVDNSFSAKGFSSKFGIDCIGQECCSNGLVYDTELLKCVVPKIAVKTGFTSIEQAYNIGEFSGNIVSNYNNPNSSLIFTSYP